MMNPLLGNSQIELLVDMHRRAAEKRLAELECKHDQRRNIPARMGIDVTHGRIRPAWEAIIG